MQVTPEIKARVAADVKKYVGMAEKHFGRSYQVPQVEYTVVGQRGGFARGTGLVNFNAVLLMENVEDFIARTVPHEVAHCIDTANGGNARKAFQRKRSVHGPSWKAIMRLFGIADSTRCHSYDTSNAQTRTKRKFEYACGGCGKPVLVSSVIHNKIQLRGIEYWTRCCGRGRGKLVFKQNLGQVTFQEATVAAEARKTTKEVPVSILVPKPPLQGNVAIAKSIWLQYGGNLTRGQFMVRAIEKGMNSGTASTYYANLKAGRM